MKRLIREDIEESKKSYDGCERCCKSHGTFFIA